MVPLSEDGSQPPCMSDARNSPCKEIKEGPGLSDSPVNSTKKSDSTGHFIQSDLPLTGYVKLQVTRIQRI